MFLLTPLLILASLSGRAISAPAAELAERQTTQYCGQWDQVTVGSYILYLDQWGLSGASSGSDCAWVTSSNGSTVAWTTNWTWVGGTGVKSFTNIAATTNLNTQLSAITSMQTTWKWSQTTTGTVVADIAYDTFTSSSPGGSAQYEIMVWLANINAGPIASSYSSTGQPLPLVSNIVIGSYTWNLYYGSNGVNLVYSFLPANGASITSFSGDLKAFFTYLINNQGFSASQYLTTAEAGTEATSGSAVLTTSSYSLVIAAGGSTGPTSTTSKATSTTTSTASGATQSHYGQCGGTGWTGPTVCASPYVCTYSNPFYSQCL